MDDIIRKGDLVCVVRDCCGKRLGQIFIVEQIVLRDSLCGFCKAIYDNTYFAGYGKRGRPLSWLKKINPPAIEIETERETEITP